MKVTNSVMASSVVVGGILLAGDQLLRMEKLAVSSGPDFVDYSGLQIHEDSPKIKLFIYYLQLPLSIFFTSQHLINLSIIWSMTVIPKVCSTDHSWFACRKSLGNTYQGI